MSLSVCSFLLIAFKMLSSSLVLSNLIRTGLTMIFLIVFVLGVDRFLWVSMVFTTSRASWAIISINIFLYWLFIATWQITPNFSSWKWYTCIISHFLVRNLSWHGGASGSELSCSYNQGAPAVLYDGFKLTHACGQSTFIHPDVSRLGISRHQDLLMIWHHGEKTSKSERTSKDRIQNLFVI